ncbi:MAG: EamA family transporter, partial [Acidimicrobiia bacterium]|nr:EamA family transporter [Acidimicrobiia bacterium]
MSAVFALLASLTYGASDFLGGLLGRRMPTMVVLVWSQGTGLILAVAGSLVVAADHVVWTDFVWGGAGGLAGTVGLYCLYQGLAEGRMAVVSPVAALVGVLVPAGVGLTLGERPLPVEWIGMLLALPAIWLVASVGHIEGTGGLGFGIVAGLGFGFFFAAVAQTGDGSGLWPLVGARITQVSVLVVLALRRRLGVPPPGSRIAVMALGAGDILANVFVLLAFRSGLLTLAGVLTS